MRNVQLELAPAQVHENSEGKRIPIEPAGQELLLGDRTVMCGLVVRCQTTLLTWRARVGSEVPRAAVNLGRKTS